MKYKWSNLIFLLFILQNTFAQNDAQEAKILQNEYGEIVYGNKQFPIIAFFQQDSLKYIYSQTKNKIAILRKDNTILKEIAFKNKDFTIPRFQPYGSKSVILQTNGLENNYVLLENQDLIAQKRNNPKNKKIIGFKEVLNGKFQVHQYLITPSKTLSKVLLHQTDTLYKDTQTKNNRTINISPRFGLVYWRDKVCFFNADQRLILIFEAQTGKLLQEINLKEQEDEFLRGFMLNFYIDHSTDKIYISGVLADKTYIWEVKTDKSVVRYELPFRVYLIHQIREDKIYFSLQTEGNNLYVYERKFK
jgi:hypothetical protein